jgi:hypothetical protein
MLKPSSILNASATEPAFLNFFYRQIKENDTGRHLPYFPYLSPCGKERNFLRCDDTPIVFHSLLPVSEMDRRRAALRRKRRRSSDDNDGANAAPTPDAAPSIPPSQIKVVDADTPFADEPHELVYGGTLSVPFEPQRLRMTETGRLYYPAPGKTGRETADGERLALIASHLALRLSQDMTFGTTTHIHWLGKDCAIDASLPGDDEADF